jgi:hypothetical protein
VAIPKKEEYIFYQGERFQIGFYFNFLYEGGKIIITNGYMKKSQKVSRRDLEKAGELKKDYICRVKGGSYYGKN